MRTRTFSSPSDLIRYLAGEPAGEKRDVKRTLLTNIQDEVIEKYHVDLCDGTRCADGDWTRTHAHPQQRRVCKWKQKNSIAATLELFHEIGHIETHRSKMRRCEQEYYATVWAIKKMQEYGIADRIPENIKNRYQSYIFCELDRGIRRGGKGYPSRKDLTLDWQAGQLC